MNQAMGAAAVMALSLAGTGPAAADVWTFNTPSGNIYCDVGLSAESSDIFCVIARRSGPPAAPRPASCDGVWGHGFGMTSSGRAEMVCTLSAEAFEGQDVIPYGRREDFGGVVCESERTGLTCTNRDGHGFFLSRRQQSIF